MSYRFVLCYNDIVFYIAIQHEQFGDVFHVEKIQYRFLKHQHQAAHDKKQHDEDGAARAANRPRRILEKFKNDNHYWYVVVGKDWPPGSTTLADFSDLLCCDLVINEMKVRMGLPGVSQHCDRLSKQFARRNLRKGFIYVNKIFRNRYLFCVVQVLR